uniref:CD99 molecule (Xg blood group) n=1 Tax=Leptobrachium leishanense TaxID=445787 RepID=A0A8C5P8W4_9ANUR
MEYIETSADDNFFFSYVLYINWAVTPDCCSRSGEDFDLSDAFDGPTDLIATLEPDPQPVETTPKKPVAPSKAAPVDDGFDLGDAVPEGPTKPANKPVPGPQPGNPGGGGGDAGTFSDSDLFDGDLPKDPHSGGDHNRNKASDGEEQAAEAQPNMIAGIVSGVAVAAVGAVSSFIAYQKKKLCFKGASEDPENVHMENQKDPADPQVLLPK